MTDHPYRPLSVPVDIEAEKRKQAAIDKWNTLTPLERARIQYENAAIANVQRDPELRRRQVEHFKKVEAEYLRCLRSD